MQRVTARVTVYFLRDLPGFRLFATRYHHFFKKLLIYIFHKFDGNAFQIAPNHAKLRENVW